MDPVTGMVIAGGLGAGLNFLGGRDARKTAEAGFASDRAKQQEILARLDALDIPTEDKLRIMLETPELAGLLQAENLGPSAMENIELDPRLREARMKALNEYSNLSQAGFSDEDLYLFDEASRQTQGDETARQNAIMQEMAQRGQGGQELQTRLLSAANTAQRQGVDQQRIAADAVRAKRDALGRMSGLAGEIEGTDYSRASDLARARDAINEFNTRNSQSVNAANLAARQGINNSRADIANQQEMYNKQVPLQTWDMGLQKATGAAAPLSSMGSSSRQEGLFKAQNTADAWGNMAKVPGDLASLYNQYQSSKSNQQSREPASTETLTLKESENLYRPY